MNRKVKGYKGSYFSYVTLYVSIYFAMGSFTSVLPLYLTDIGKSAGEMSFIVSASSFFSLVLGPLAGYLCDRIRRPRLISGIAAAGMGAGALAFAFCRGIWPLFLLQGLTMSFFSVTQPVSEQLAASSPYRYGVLRIWGTFGYAAGAQAAGLAVQSFPGPVLFSMVAVSALIAAFGFASVDGRQEAPAPQKKREAEAVQTSAGSFLRNPYFLLYLGITFLAMGCSAVNNTYLPLLLKDFGVSAGAIGTALSVGTLVEVPVILFSNKFMDRFSSKFLLLGNMGIFTLQYLLYAMARSSWAAILPLVLLKAIATTLLMMLNLKVVRNLIAPEFVTSALAAVNACNGLGSVLLQNAGGAFAEAFPVKTLYLVLAGIAFLTLLLSLFLRVEDKERIFG